MVMPHITKVMVRAEMGREEGRGSERLTSPITAGLLEE
jgi:hypothetical protein